MEETTYIHTYVFGQTTMLMTIILIMMPHIRTLRGIITNFGILSVHIKLTACCDAVSIKYLRT